jgi:hypothetical protein
MRNLVLACGAILLLGGCSHIPGMGKASTTPSASAKPTGPQLAKASGQLDAQVPMPPDFPGGIPVYPNARLTAGASFVSTGEVTWGMEWESLDAMSKVAAYYLDKFNQSGDWTFTATSHGNSFLDGTIARKSDPQVTGTVAITDDQTIRMIALSLVSSG